MPVIQTPPLTSSSCLASSKLQLLLLRTIKKYLTLLVCGDKLFAGSHWSFSVIPSFVNFYSPRQTGSDLDERSVELTSAGLFGYKNVSHHVEPLTLVRLSVPSQIQQTLLKPRTRHYAYFSLMHGTCSRAGVRL